jgi:aryl-alcohol dehydrogenase-like predicted oxidoreductase
MRYRVLGQHTGLRVSELILGTGMFGTKWGHGADDLLSGAPTLGGKTVIVAAEDKRRACFTCLVRRR